MTLRISSLTTGLRKVIEIGGGYGGLARTMRLFNPHQTYIIVDLLDSLYCSYVFLSTHYPDAKMLFVTKSEDATGMDDFDFVFVPTQHFAVLSGGSVDLIVNTASFGEMLQRDVDAYMQFINYSAKARYFYSVNRYARYESDMSLADQANASVKLSPDWEILYWNAFGTGSFHQLDPHTPPQLELLARHIPADQLLAQARQRIAALLESSSRALPPSGSDWHFCMWEATRLFPAQPVIEKYIAGASPQTFRDADYYRELMETASPTASTLPIGVDLNAGISDKRSRGASVRDIRGWIGALFKR